MGQRPLSPSAVSSVVTAYFQAPDFRPCNRSTPLDWNSSEPERFATLQRSAPNHELCPFTMPSAQEEHGHAFFPHQARAALYSQTKLRRKLAIHGRNRFSSPEDDLLPAFTYTLVQEEAMQLLNVLRIPLAEALKSGWPWWAPIAEALGGHPRRDTLRSPAHVVRRAANTRGNCRSFEVATFVLGLDQMPPTPRFPASARPYGTP